MLIVLMIILQAVSPEIFGRCFLNCVQEVFKVTESQVVVIDGKTMHGLYDRSSNKVAKHIVSAWASKNCITFRGE